MEKQNEHICNKTKGAFRVIGLVKARTHNRTASIPHIQANITREVLAQWEQAGKIEILGYDRSLKVKKGLYTSFFLYTIYLPLDR